MYGSWFALKTRAIALLLLLCGGCGPSDPEFDACPGLVEAHLTGSIRQRLEEFARYDLETRYAIYICGSQYLHPPALELAVQLGAGGSETANFLRNKLVETTSDATVRDILYVYSEMDRQGTYAVTQDASLMRLLNERVGQIRDPSSRLHCSTLLTEMARD